MVPGYTPAVALKFETMPIEYDACSAVGLIPAAGIGSRLSLLPCSKEIFPLGFANRRGDGGGKIKVVCQYLLDNMRQAGINKAFVILRPGKWDIPAYLGSGQSVGINLAYVIRKLPFGVPFTLDSAFPYVQNCNVVFGLPDIIIQPSNAFSLLLKRLETTAADLVLGIFPTQHPHKWDLVEFGRSGELERITPKPHDGKSGFTWCLAVWSPRFSLFLHRFAAIISKYLMDHKKFHLRREIQIGAAFQRAIDKGLKVDFVHFDEGSCIDIGTPEDLQTVMRSSLDLHA